MYLYPGEDIDLVSEFVKLDFDHAIWKDLGEQLGVKFGIKREDVSAEVKNKIQAAFFNDRSFEDITVEYPERQGSTTHRGKADEWRRRQENGYWTNDDRAECKMVIRIIRRVLREKELLPSEHD